jgi:hypothetical protein
MAAAISDGRAKDSRGGLGLPVHAGTIRRSCSLGGRPGGGILSVSRWWKV